MHANIYTYIISYAISSTQGEFSLPNFHTCNSYLKQWQTGLHFFQCSLLMKKVLSELLTHKLQKANLLHKIHYSYFRYIQRNSQILIMEFIAFPNAHTCVTHPLSKYSAVTWVISSVLLPTYLFPLRSNYFSDFFSS